jgi:hypothetical protein
VFEQALVAFGHEGSSKLAPHQQLNLPEQAQKKLMALRKYIVRRDK